MAKIKNITADVLSLFRPDAPPVEPGDEITLRDQNFVDRAWPTSTWELVEAPVLEGELSGYVDQSTEGAILWAEPVEEPEIAVEAGPEINAADLPPATTVKPRTRAKKQED